MQIIDAHAHLVPASFPSGPRGEQTPGWPSMVARGDGRASMMIDGKEFRVIDPGYFNVDARLEHMEREGILAQVISPLPELLGHWLAPDVAHALAEITNAAIADAVASAPDRLAGLGMLPLQDIERSLEMIADIAALGLRGIEAPSNVNGCSFADARFRPLLAELARRNLCVFVHGSRPAGPERQLGPKLMSNVIGIPQDEATVISSFIVTDILAAVPGLRLGFGHCGGAFGAVLDRMDYVWSKFPALREECSTAPRDYVRKFYFDAVTYSARYLRFAIEAFGPETLMCGTDGPGFGAQSDLGGLALEAAAGDAPLAEKLLSGNALRFLGWENAADAPLRRV